MKVLHLISGGDKGGAKTHVFTLLSALMEEIDIKIICFMEGVFYNEILNMPIPSMLIKQKFRNDLTVIDPLVKHIRQEKYNMIHAHGARANFIAMFIRPFIKIPIITTVHSDYKLDFTENIYKKYFYTGLNKMALNYMDYYIAVSDNFKEMLVERGFDADSVYTVYNTIDFEQEIRYDEKEVFLNRFGIDAQGKTIVGIIGRFDLVKGHDVFINAAAEILKKRQDVLFLLAGEGTEQHNLEQQAKKLGIRVHLVFTGFIEDIFSFINAIDINVLSSHSESFPYVLLEGAMMKKATVSTGVGGIVDLIKEGKTGYLAKAGDYKTLADKICLLIENKALRETLGQNLYAYAKRNFSKESMKKSHVQIYKSILQAHKDQNKLFDAVLSGYYGFDNSGDDAILKAIIEALRRENKEIKILVFSKKPLKTMEEHDVFSVSRHNFFKIIKYMKRSRVFIYGGGSLIQDITSTKSLFYYTILLEIAKHFGLNLMIYANGIGPITKKYNFKRAKRAIEICNYISLRDPESFNVIHQIGAENENINISIDPVLNLNMDSSMCIQKIFEKEKISLDKKYFTISLRTWKYNEPAFCDKMAKVIDYISEKYNMIPLYAAMQNDDYNIIKDVIARTKSEYILLSEIYEVSKLMAIISKTQIVISMRLHALIYAVSSSVPVIGLEYDPKVKNFMAYLNEKYYVNTSGFDENELMGMADDILNNYDHLVERISKRSEELKKLSLNDAKEAIKLI